MLEPSPEVFSIKINICQWSIEFIDKHELDVKNAAWLLLIDEFMVEINMALVKTICTP